MLTVLVLDDDQEFRRAMAEALADTAVVIGAATPVEALWELERAPIDILICDLMLAVSVDGVDVLTTVRELHPRVGRILVTGFGSALARNDLPAHAIMLKPCELGALRDLLRMLPIITGPDAPESDSQRSARSVQDG